MKNFIKKATFSLLLLTLSLKADFGDFAGPAIGGAAIGGIFGGGKGAAIGAGVGAGIGIMNSSARDRDRYYGEPVYYDYEPYYQTRPVRYVRRPYRQTYRRPVNRYIHRDSEIIYVD